MTLVKVGPLAELPPGGLTEVHYGGRTFAVCNVEGEVHALDGICPHQGGALGQGNLIDNLVICPWHAWEFDCRTGALEGSPGIQQQTYPVRIQAGDIYLELP